MAYGETIGKKFGRDGKALPYPGNTVISHIPKGSPAFQLLSQARERLLASPAGKTLIPLPEDSYHMTVIRGVNDLVRADAYWPAALPKDAPMAEVDAYVSRAVGSVTAPERIQMAFHEAHWDDGDVRIRLCPASHEQAAVLKAYRDQVADALGLRLPGHAGYSYHITLFYTLTLPDPGERAALSAWADAMDGVLAAAPPFLVDAPRMAYYQDMLRFDPAPCRG